ncbi:S41 family peptidase [Sediminibacterium roseum]|uniref:S41 family peptidase n=1 Tax=Sediminibacterium roseum TaxID=1978412 RepID=A0ABW9ZTH9_9BACT|nr:S41 family peptidase [Sediminibacterium roseum]NCI49717.1 S41 family peptidase [Sediminibacterium roseum]
MGSKKLQVWLPVLFAIVMVVGMMIGYQLKDKAAGNKFFNLNRRTSIQDLVELIRNRYVDKVNVDSINQLAASELLSHLDPHSVYIPANKVKEANEDLMGNFQGIGVEFQILADTVNIMHVIEGGPSEKVGLKVGDRMLAVNDTAKVAGVNITSDGIRKLLRGEEGSTVKVQVLRDGVKRDFMIQRGVIPVSPIDAAYMIEPGTGYLRINKFADRTYEAFMLNMEKLQKQGMKQLILDLRGNGGGLLKEAISIADAFLSGDKLIVYTEGENMKRAEYKCSTEGIFETGKLEVLIDETSASASEVLAGALQDWDRATIIGRRSFGKGLVQQPFILSDGSEVRLTIARYYSPLGRNIQKPYAKGKAIYEEELMERYHNGEVVVGDTAKPTGKAYKTPGGRTVYGGGGITPDVFVPMDTTHMDPAAVKLYYKSTLNSYVYHYYINNRPFFDKMKNPEQLTKEFVPGEKEWQGLVSFAKKDTINLAPVTQKGKTEVLKRIQSLMARQIWRAGGFFEVSNRTDPTIQRALEGFK